MKDSYGREISYLRISVTDRCNLRCRYCMPEEGVQLKKHEEILTYEQILSIARVCADLGVNKIRLTGGEPLVRKGIEELIESLIKLPGIEEVNLTTNGILLSRFAKHLKDAGIKQINIALNSLNAEKYANITRGGNLMDVLNGLEAALFAGFDRVKVNVVIMKGYNDDEIMDFVYLTKHSPILVRFIELMPIAEADKYANLYIPADEIMQGIKGLMEVSGNFGNGPAKYYNIEDHKGLIGFITPVSGRFCSECNRIRLTADGKLITCLHSEHEFDLKNILELNDDAQLSAEIEHLLKKKPEGHDFNELQGKTGRSCCSRFMSQVGG